MQIWSDIHELLCLLLLVYNLGHTILLGVLIQALEPDAKACVMRGAALLKCQWSMNQNLFT